MPKILVVRDDGRVEEMFEELPTRGPEWPGMALQIQRAVKRAQEEGAGDGQVLVPVVDFIGPAFTLLTRAEASVDFGQALSDLLMEVINNYNSVLDTPLDKWDAETLYKSILDWKINLMPQLAQIIHKYNVNGGELDVDAPTD